MSQPTITNCRGCGTPLYTNERGLCGTCAVYTRLGHELALYMAAYRRQKISK